MISICSATSVSPRESLERATSTCSRIALSGFLTSCATPLEMRLMAVRRSAVWSSRLILRCASGSLSRTRTPLGAAGPPGRLSSISTDNSTIAGPGKVWLAVATGTRRLRIDRPVCDDCATSRPSVVDGGNRLEIACPGRSDRSRPRNFSTEPEAKTSRSSRLKMKTASSKSCSRWSMLPRRSETSNCAPRKRCPSRLTFDAITESSSLAMLSEGRTSSSYSPLAARSSICPMLPSERNIAIENRKVSRTAPATERIATSAF